MAKKIESHHLFTKAECLNAVHRAQDVYFQIKFGVSEGRYVKVSKPEALHMLHQLLRMETTPEEMEMYSLSFGNYDAVSKSVWFG